MEGGKCIGRVSYAYLSSRDAVCEVTIHVRYGTIRRRYVADTVMGNRPHDTWGKDPHTPPHVTGHIFASFAFQKLRLGLVRVQTVPYIHMVP